MRSDREGAPLTSTSARVFRLGDRHRVVAQIRAALSGQGLLPPDAATGSDGLAGSYDFDPALDAAVRAFQQDRGLTVDGVVGSETWAHVVASQRRLGDRLLGFLPGSPYKGDDVRELQERLLEMGFDGGRADGIFGSRTDGALKAFQRQIGLRSDGWCGPQTKRALDQLRPRARDGNPHELRESEAMRRRGPGLAGKSVVVDPGHGGDDAGWIVGGLVERDIVFDVATRLQGRLQATGATAELTRGPTGAPSDAARAALANSTEADLLISLHCDGADTSRAHGIATYYYGTGLVHGSVVGGRLAGLIQREVVARLPGVLDARTHAKTWELLRATRMPAVRVELGYLTHPEDAARLSDPAARDTYAEALLVAIQRLFLPVELDPPTGTMRLSDLAASLRPY